VRNRQTYPDELRVHALRKVLGTDGTRYDRSRMIARVADTFAIDEATLREWVREADGPHDRHAIATHRSRPR
jgi:transposase-like protein